MDVLSDMLGSIRLSSTVFAQTAFVGPWGIRAGGGEHFAFHVLSRGRAWLEVDGMAPVEIEAGEVVVISPGRGHTLRNAPETPARDLFEMLAAGEFDRPVSLVPTDAPSSTLLICGCFQLEDLPRNPLLAALPPMIHTREMANDVGPWLAQTIKLLTYESLAERPGAATVVDRLCDALFVYILRSHLATLPEHEASWLRALVEPQVGEALRLMHDKPTTNWTVAQLARSVGMSRSAFAARFANVVGEAPMQYLIQWRMQKAAAMLRPGGSDVAEAASMVGYESTAAFSKAFKRAIGVAPGAYRRGGSPTRGLGGEHPPGASAAV